VSAPAGALGADRSAVVRRGLLLLCSVALDLRVTQLVDGTKGVHGMLAKSLFP
jgi:acetamidase/formamidase